VTTRKPLRKAMMRRPEDIAMERHMARKATPVPADQAETGTPASATVAFLKSYRPAEPPDGDAAADPCWKYEVGAIAALPYAEARRAVTLEIAKVVLEGEAP
jgi:hypothetical protein